MKTWITVALLVLVGCRRAPPPVEETPPVAAEAPPVAAEAPPAPTTSKHRISIAEVRDGTLQGCTDVDVEIHAPDQGAPPREKLSEGMTYVDRPCSESFADRTVLATCTHTQELEVDAGPNATLAFKAHVYDFERALGSDDEMLSCLREKGAWWALKKGSPEWRKARRDDNMRDLKSASRNLQRALAAESEVGP
jgi:hypothetical protein